MAEIEENRDSARDGVAIDWSNIPDPVATLRKIRSVKGAKMQEGSDNWHIALALLRGKAVGDYREDTHVYNREGRRIYNIRSRHSDLENNWQIPILTEKVKGKQYVQYRLDSHAHSRYKDSARDGLSPSPSTPNTADQSNPTPDNRGQFNKERAS